MEDEIGLTLKHVQMVETEKYRDTDLERQTHREIDAGFFTLIYLNGGFLSSRSEDDTEFISCNSGNSEHK